MKALARGHGFHVTVGAPHLVSAVLAHAFDAAFATVNLRDALAPHAADGARELLSLRDDDRSLQHLVETRRPVQSGLPRVGLLV